MSKLSEKIKLIQNKIINVSADEIEQGYTIPIKKMDGGTYLYWSEICMDKSGALYKASNTEKMLLALALSIVDDEGKLEYQADDYKELNKLPSSLLTRLVNEVVNINFLDGQQPKKS